MGMPGRGPASVLSPPAAQLGFHENERPPSWGGLPRGCVNLGVPTNRRCEPFRRPSPYTRPDQSIRDFLHHRDRRNDRPSPASSGYNPFGPKQVTHGDAKYGPPQPPRVHYTARAPMIAPEGLSSYAAPRLLQALPRPPPMTAPVAPNTTNVNVAMAQVGALIVGRLRRFQPDPPSCAVPCAGDLSRPPYPKVYASTPIPSPQFFDKPCDTPNIAADLDIIDGQRQFPGNAPFGETMLRVRCFDKSAANGRRYPRPTPPPLDPATHPPTTLEETTKGRTKFPFYSTPCEHTAPKTEEGRLVTSGTTCH